MSFFIKRFFGNLLNLIYPSLCVTCGRHLPAQSHYLCPVCLIQIPRTQFHLVQENFVEELFWGRVMIEKASSFMYFTKGSKYQGLIHHLKYHGLKEIGFMLGKMYGSELSSTPYSGADMIIPVPLHPRKKRKRGFNQSEWIALGLGESLGIPVRNSILKRNQNTPTQTRKSRFERWQNVERAFVVDETEPLENKKIILVDDVITTGATLEACANALKRSANVKIFIATLGVAWN